MQFKKNLSVIKEKNSLLDVGCSSGFFLKTAMDLGFLDVRGVEPGKASVDEAEQFIRDRIKNEMFSSKLYPPESFDVVSAFQVFDHVLNPKEFLQDIKSVLKKDGVLFAINHNIESYMPVLMGEHSPMYDIEHIYLFNKNTMRKLLEQNGFKIIKIENIPNTYVLEYCLKMFPMPRFLKKTLVAITNKMKLNNVQIRIPAGNMVTIAKKQ